MDSLLFLYIFHRNTNPACPVSYLLQWGPTHGSVQLLIFPTTVLYETVQTDSAVQNCCHNLPPTPKKTGSGLNTWGKIFGPERANTHFVTKKPVHQSAYLYSKFSAYFHNFSSILFWTLLRITAIPAYKQLLVTFLNTTQQLETALFPTANALSEVIPVSHSTVQMWPMLVPISLVVLRQASSSLSSSLAMSLIAFSMVCLRSLFLSPECNERISRATKLPNVAYSSSSASISQLLHEVTVSCASLSLVSVVLRFLFLDGEPWLSFPLEFRFLGACAISLVWSSLSLGWNETRYRSERVLILQMPNAKNVNFLQKLLYLTACDICWHFI